MILGFFNHNWPVLLFISLFCRMSLIKTSCFHLSIGMNPRTQNKDSLEDSISTSPDPSKREQLTGVGSGWGWSGHEEARGSSVRIPHISGVLEDSMVKESSSASPMESEEGSGQITSSGM